MQGFGQKSVYYAHAGAGELHLRPILNLKTSEGVKLLHDISNASAELVKKYTDPCLVNTVTVAYAQPSLRTFTAQKSTLGWKVSRKLGIQKTYSIQAK